MLGGFINCGFVIGMGFAPFTRIDIYTKIILGEVVRFSRDGGPFVVFLSIDPVLRGGIFNGLAIGIRRNLHFHPLAGRIHHSLVGISDARFNLPESPLPRLIGPDNIAHLRCGNGLMARENNSTARGIAKFLQQCLVCSEVFGGDSKIHQFKPIILVGEYRRSILHLDKLIVFCSFLPVFGRGIGDGLP